jgi:hypothetical protein
MELEQLPLLSFLALTPGLFFLFGLRANEARMSPQDLFESHIQEILTLLFTSLAAEYVVFCLWMGIWPDCFDAWVQQVSGLIGEGSKPRAKDVFPVMAMAMCYAMIVYAIVYLSGVLSPRVLLRKRNGETKPTANGLREFLFNVKDDEVVLGWILTTTMHDGKSVLYYGPVRNMKLQKDTISHVVLRFPTKTYMDMGQHLNTNHAHASLALPRELANIASDEESGIYIPSCQIANAYFEKLLLPSPAKPVAHPWWSWRRYWP